MALDGAALDGAALAGAALAGAAGGWLACVAPGASGAEKSRFTH
ncbi:hypothetical protein [Massilia atriviolacea]|nr:hypothetical protein [Massilia atriviolacea]